MKTTIGEISTPILTQHLTDLMFQKMIRQHFLLNEATTLALPPPLTETEQKAIRYAAGYVCRHTRHKLEKNGNSNTVMEEMVLAIMQMVGDDDDDNEDDIGSNGHKVSKSWINTIDRGGLWKIKTSIYLYSWKQHYRTNTCSETGRSLLKMIADLWITIRRFSFASGWMIEQHK